MGYYDEWKKKRSASSEQGSTHQKSDYDEWKKHMTTPSGSKENLPSDEDDYDYDVGAARIERLKYYSDKAKEYNSILAVPANTPNELGARNQAFLDLQNLYVEYDKEFGTQRIPSIKREAETSASLINNLNDSIVFANGAPKVDFDKLLVEAEAKHNKYTSEKNTTDLYNSIISSPDYEDIINKGKEDAKSYMQYVIDDYKGRNNLITYADRAAATHSVDNKNFTIYLPSYERGILPTLMTEKEQLVYNWYWGNEDYDKANEYFESLKPYLEERAHAKAQENTYIQSKEKPVYSSIQSVVRSVYGTPIDTVINAGKAVINGDGHMDRNRMADLVNIARTGVSEDMSPVGRFLYNTAMSGADSLLSGLSFGNAGGVALALSAGASTYNESIDKGMDEYQAARYGLMAGIFEGVFESISLGRVLKEVPVDTWVDVVKNLALSMGINASEEMATEIANLTYDSIANGEFSQYAELRKQGLGFWDIMGKFGLQTLEAGASGTLMGFGFGVMQSGTSAINVVSDTINTGKGIKKEGLTDTYIEKGLQYEGTQVYNAAIKAQNKATNYRVGRLAQTLTKSALQTSFTEATGSRKTATNLTDVIMGREVSQSAVSDILGNEKALNALNETLGTSIKKDTDIKTFRKEVAEAVVRQTDNVIDSLGELGESVKELVQGNIISDKQIDAVLKNEKARAVLSLRTGVEITKDSTVRDVKRAVTEARNDNSRARLALVYAGILDMGTNGSKAVSRLVANSSVNVASAVQAFNAVYQMGKQGKAISEARSPYLSELTMPQRLAAYEYGVMDGLTSKAANEKTTAEAEISTESEAPEGAIVTKGGETIVPVKENTKEQKRIIDMGKKLGIDVVIADIKKGKENIDGLWDGKTLYINPKPNSGNPMFTLLKHELTHFTQNSSKYESFLKSVIDSKEFISWLRKKGYKSKEAYIAQITKDYKRVNKNLTPEQAQEEMVANFVGDVLFAEDGALERFVNTLSPDHKRTFGELIHDFIAWIKKKLGALSEIEMLELKYAELFKDAKRDGANDSVENIESSYSISPDLDSEIDMVLNGTFKAHNNEVYLGETSNFMIDVIGAEALKLYMPASKVYSSLVTEEEYNKNPYYGREDNYHGIGKADFMEILEKSETPILAFVSAPNEKGNNRRNRIVLVTDKKILDLETGKKEYAVVVEEIDTEGWRKGKRVRANKTITVFPRSQLEASVIDALVNHRLLYTTKKGERLFAGIQGTNPQGAIQKDILKKNIAYFWANVKWEKQKNKTFSTKEPELPSAFQLALEKAGYIDQDGHIKYMQESEDSSQDKNGSVETKDGTHSYSYTPPKSEAEMSTRELLANMLDSVAESEREKNLLAKYKGHLAKIEESRAEIARLREERKSADKAHKKLYTSQIEKLENAIVDSNKWLIKLEETSTIKRLVAKEREAMRDEAHLAGQMAQGRRDAAILRHVNERAEAERKAHNEELAEHREEARQMVADATLAGQMSQGRKDAAVYKARLAKQAKRYQEAHRRDVDGRHATVVKHKIGKVVKQLDSLLRHGNKERHVHIGLQDAVAAALEIFDINAERTQRYAKDIAALDERIAQLEVTDPDSVDLEALVALREKKQRNSQSLADKLEKMRKAYEDIHKGRVEEDISPYYKEEAKAIESVISDTIEKIGGVLYEDMNLEQLEAVYKMYRVVLTTVQNANKVFKGDKLADLAEDASAMELELLDIAKLNEERWEGADRAREFIWNELTPYYAMKRIGSDTLMEYYWELIRGQNVYARDIAEAKSFAEATRKKYGADKWDLNKVYTIIDKDGRKFKLTLEHMMSIYAYSKRDQALDHMEKGGFFFNDKATFKKVGGVLKFIKANESGYKVDADVMAEILGTLNDIDENIVHYVDEMQDYLTKMGEKGNEVTRKMWGIDIFTEKVYFPLMSKEDFIYQANTPAETSSLKNDGMTKETRPHASNPIVLESFDDVWTAHVEKMSKYHGFVIPIDNLNKLVNYSWMGGKDTQVKLSEKDKTEGKIAADFIAEVVQMQDKVRRSKRKKKIGLPSPAHIQKIESLMKTIKGDFSADGYEVWIDGTAADHIVRRHGENGVADHSMAERESRELIPWVINNPDSGEFIRNFDGTLDLSNRYFNADGSGAPQIRLEKQLDGDTVYVSECVPDSANKRIHITSAYIKKGSTDQLLNMDPTSGTPQPTSKTSFDGSTTNNSIAHQNKNVNKNFSPNSEMGSHSISTMLAARYSSAVNEYLTTFIKDLNGAKAQSGPVASFFTGLFSKFKKTSVAASLSVVVQQPTAILRAYSEIDAKYFVSLPKSVSLNRRWELIQKYAPVAIIKDIGGFDAGSGRTATEWLGADTKRGLDKVMSKADDLTMYGAALGDRLGWGSIWVACEREVAATRDLTPSTEEFYEAVGERFTEVIVKTQVYDSTLSRSGFMRGKDGLMKMATAFMGEPTLSFNMIADAILQAKRGKITKKVAARTIGAVYASILAATIAKSFIYALRDDDEDESYVEKLVQSFGGNIVNDINPLSMLPVFRDVVSIFDGWDVARTDMALVEDLYAAFTSLDSDNKSVYRKIEDLAGATAAFAGIPAKNLLRTGREMYNLFENLFDGISGGDLGKAFKEGFTGKQTSKGEALYDALVSGDTGRIKIYRESYDDESKYKTAVKKALRDYDPRVQKAVERALSGDYGTYNELKRAVRSEKKFDADTVNNAFADEREYVLGKLKDARKARREGKMDEYNKIIDQLVKRGYSRSFINNKLK